MKFTRIEFSIADRVARIVLNRPEKRNALDEMMIRELDSAFHLVAGDSVAKVVALSAHGPAFCAGADLESLQRLSEYDLEQNLTDSTLLANLFRTIYEFPKPVIALVNGPALAGGCGLATVCDFVLATNENARFGYTEVKIGFVPAIVLTFLIRRVGEGRAREMVLRGKTLTAADAYDIGLVNYVIQESSLESLCEEICRELVTQNSATAMALCKSLMGTISHLDVPSALSYAARVNAEARMTDECRKGVDAFLKKKRPQW